MVRLHSLGLDELDRPGNDRPRAYIHPRPGLHVLSYINSLILTKGNEWSRLEQLLLVHTHRHHMQGALGHDHAGLGDRDPHKHNDNVA